MLYQNVCCLTLEDKTGKLSQNVDIQLQIHSTYEFRRAKNSTTLRRNPHTAQTQYHWHSYLGPKRRETRRKTQGIKKAKLWRDSLIGWMVWVIDWMTDLLFRLPVPFHSAVSVSDYTESMDGRLANGELE